jgi:hypothetical protein
MPINWLIESAANVLDCLISVKIIGKFADSRKIKSILTVKNIMSITLKP